MLHIAKYGTELFQLFAFLTKIQALSWVLSTSKRFRTASHVSKSRKCASTGAARKKYAHAAHSQMLSRSSIVSRPLFGLRHCRSLHARPWKRDIFSEPLFTRYELPYWFRSAMPIISVTQLFLRSSLFSSNRCRESHISVVSSRSPNYFQHQLLHSIINLWYA
jgi:hypothetical protein